MKAGSKPLRIVALFETGLFVIRGDSEFHVDSAPFNESNAEEFTRRLMAKERLDWFVPVFSHFIAAFGDSIVTEGMPPEIVEAIQTVQARNGVIEAVAVTPSAGWVVVSREL